MCVQGKKSLNVLKTNFTKITDGKTNKFAIEHNLLRSVCNYRALINN